MKAAFSPHKIQRSAFQPVGSDVVVDSMQFSERFTQSGIIVLNDNGTGRGIRPRWGQVYAVGPDQRDVKVGDWILVAHGRWTRGLDIEDESGERTVRKIDPNDILLVSDKEPFDETESSAVHVQKQA